MGSRAWSHRRGDIGGIWQIHVHLPESPLKSGSHSEAPFNLFQVPLSICLGSLLWSTPLQNSLSKNLKEPASLSECKSAILNNKVSWLSYIYNGGLLTHCPLGDLNEILAY